MATTFTTLIATSRKILLETTASFWSDAELLEIMQRGVKDLWGALVDLHQDHFMTIDVTNVSYAASATTLTGVPADVHRVLLIEPRDTTSAGTAPSVIFKPKAYNSPEAINARSVPAVDPAAGVAIYYSLKGAGAPVAAPTVLCQPMINTALNLRFVYIPTFDATELETGDSNPIPGESDSAVIAWTVAMARAKEREDRSPDPNWLAVYATEKTNLQVRATPRQEQEPEVVSGLFEAFE